MPRSIVRGELKLMRRWDPLNDRQLDLLKRVDAGEDLSGPDHANLRHSANAVRDRGLITVSRRGGVWRAELTKAGRFYLDHGHHPDDPRFTSRMTTGSAVTAKPAPSQNTDDLDGELAEPATARANSRQPPRATIKTTERRRAEATELIEHLTVHEVYVVKAPTEADLARWRKIVDFAKRHDLVPEGRYIEKIRQWNQGRDLHIWLRKGRPVNVKRDGLDLPAIPVAETLRSPHPVVADLRDDKGRLVMPKPSRHRCLLVLQALAAEATRRGHVVKKKPVDQRHHHHYYGYGPRPTGPQYSRREGQLTVVIDGFDFDVTVQEASPNSEDPEKKKRLVLELPVYRSEGRQYRWTDGKTRTIEDGLRQPSTSWRRAPAKPGSANSTKSAPRRSARSAGNGPWPWRDRRLRRPTTARSSTTRSCGGNARKSSGPIGPSSRNVWKTLALMKTSTARVSGWGGSTSTSRGPTPQKPCRTCRPRRS
ncbi:hypothetical protein L1857_26240 [Amycolatopsis thermalba]|uniref:Uncharacterized protein n=1 Tax=Amycolatopsis thermalba TaxID=944492 RepID=A0ABY4P1F0_9PSEU|nr:MULTISPECIES: hypothetical protein [Amycolatopsis]UQS26063.1 hypothetical protein L1857_26240 [Amycolatopsis thermalba]